MSAAPFEWSEADEADVDPSTFVRPRPPRDPSQVYSIRIPVDWLEQIRQHAEARDLEPTQMLRGWILDRLDQHSPGIRVQQSATTDVLDLEAALRRAQFASRAIR